MSFLCLQLKQEYQSIKTLKVEFDLEFQKALDTGNLEKVKKLRAELEAKRNSLAEKLWTFEGLSQKEFKESYETDKAIMKENGILEILPESKELGIIGIDNEEYIYPKIETIANTMRTSKEKLKTKIEQGFIEIQITPIAQSLDKKIDVYKKLFWKHYKEKKLFATMENTKDIPQFPDDLPFNNDTIEKIKSGKLQYEDIWKTGTKYEEDENVYSDKNKALWVWEKYQNADQSGELVYYPEQFDQNNHKGKTKLELIEETKKTPFPGYIVILREKLPNIPRKDKGKTIGDRQQLEAGQTPIQYLKILKTNPIYKNETGMTPDDQIIYAIQYLERFNQVIDDYSGKGSASYQLGAYFSVSGYVPHAYWNRDARQANLDRNDPDYSYFVYGACPAVRVS